MYMLYGNRTLTIVLMVMCFVVVRRWKRELLGILRVGLRDLGGIEGRIYVFCVYMYNIVWWVGVCKRFFHNRSHC